MPRARGGGALKRSSAKRLPWLAVKRDLEHGTRLRFWYALLSGQESCDNEVWVLPASESIRMQEVAACAKSGEARAGLLAVAASFTDLSVDCSPVPQDGSRGDREAGVVCDV